MGTSHSVEEMARKLERLAVGIDGANRAGVLAAAQSTKAAIVPLMRAATGGDLKLSGMKRGLIGVRYTEQRPGSVILSAFGPAHLVERDVKPHPVLPRAAGGTRVSRRRRVEGAALIGAMTGQQVRFATKGGVLRFADGSFRRWSRTAGGSKGRHPFERGVDLARPKTGAAFVSGHRRHLLEVLS